MLTLALLALLSANPAAAAPAVEPAAKLAEAAHALGTGDLAGARAAAAAVGPDAAPAVREQARLIDGLAARAQADFPAALAALSFSGAHLGPLEPYHQLALGDARLASGDAKGAVDAFEKARDQARIDAFAARASGRLGDALLAAGQPCPAVAAFKTHLGLAESPERLDALARAQRACGDARGAAETEHRLWLLYAEHPASAALEHEFVKVAKPDERLQRAQRLLAHAGPSAALAELQLGLGAKPKAEVRAKLELLRGKALAELKQRAQANAAFQAAVKAAPGSDAGGEAQTLLARAAWRRGDLKEADALFAQLAKRRDRIGDDAAFLSAFMPMDKGNFAEGLARFEAYLSARGTSRKADEAAWFAAYAAMRSGDKPRARDGFERLAKRYPGSPLLPQALYWQARLSAPRDAEALYRSTVRAAPVSYYAALARLRLAELNAAPEPDLPRALAADPPRVALGPQAELAEALSRVGLWTERGEALDAAIRATNNPDTSAQLGALCASLGEWGRAYAIANGRLWHKALEEKNPNALALLFPRAYPDLVQHAADAWGLDPAFAWSIMRRESAFDPSVESPARAIGLMQMLTPTARKIAGLLGARELPSGPDLHQPEVELPLAVWYLAELAGRFDHAALAAASYNAGPRAVTGWLDRSGNLPFDEFVEAIPFRETRLYVKNVVGDYLTYRALYGLSTPPLSTAATLPSPHPGAEF